MCRTVCCLLSMACLAMILLLSSVAGAVTLKVPEEMTINRAVVVAVPGDVISVAPGNLDGGSVSLPSGVRLVSRPGAPNRLEFIEIHDANQPVWIEGFEIGGNIPPEPGGVEIRDARVIFSDCRFENILRSYLAAPGVGSAISYEFDCDVDFFDCEFRSNGAVGGLGSTVIGPHPIAGGWSGTFTFRGCLFEGEINPITGGGAASPGGLKLVLEKCSFRECRGQLIYSPGSLVMEGCVVSRCEIVDRVDLSTGACLGALPAIEADGELALSFNSFVDNVYFRDPFSTCPQPTPDAMGAMVKANFFSEGFIRNNIFCGQPGSAVNTWAQLDISCNLSYQSGAAHYRGVMGIVVGINDNIDAAPLFCDRTGGDYHIAFTSPAAPENNLCGQMGALPAACSEDVPVLLRDFEAQRHRDGVVIRWQLAEAAELLLERRQEGKSVELVRSFGLHGSYVDVDAPSAELRYVLRSAESGEAVASRSVTAALAQRSLLASPFPNPANPATAIRFELGGPGHRFVELAVLDAAGRVVDRLLAESLPAGSHAVRWRGTDASGRAVASGVYYTLLRVDGALADTGKLALVR